MADERRRHVRKQVDLAGALAYGDELIECHVSDMSAGGASIDVTTPPPFGTKVKLTFTLPTGAELAVDGIVRWRRAAGVGIQFSPMGARQTYHLTEFLSSMDPMPDSRMVGR